MRGRHHGPSADIVEQREARPMSAWIVSKTHIDLLVTAGLEYSYYGGDFSWYHESSDGEKLHRLNRGNANEAGQMLWAENLASVADRDPNDVDGERPGPVDFRDEHVLTYRYTPVPGVNRDPTTLAAVGKALACYEYQSCEHDGWKTSSAKAYCQSLRCAILDALPGADKAPWGFDDRNYFLTHSQI